MIANQDLIDDFSAQEILRLAGEANKRMDSFSREDLVRAAAELDIDAQWVSDAVQIVYDRQSEIDDREEFRRYHVKQTWLHICLGIPVLLMLLFAHTISVFMQLMSVFKGGAKGITALFFARSTGSELEFQTWRNKRLYKAEYGAEEPAEILLFYMREKKTADFEQVVDFLVETNAIDRYRALAAVAAYSEVHRSKIVNREGSLKYPAQYPKSIWSRDLRRLFKNRNPSDP